AARRSLGEVWARAADVGLPTAAVLHDGEPCSVADAMAALGEHGRHGALDPAEGVVYRIERQGSVRVQAKYVRAELVPGRYLADHSGEGQVWNSWTGGWTREDAGVDDHRATS